MAHVDNVTLGERKRTTLHIFKVNTFVVAITVLVWLVLKKDFSDNIMLGNQLGYENDSAVYLLIKECFHPYCFVFPCICIIYGGALLNYVKIKTFYLKLFDMIALGGIVFLIQMMCVGLALSYTSPFAHFLWTWYNHCCL